MPEPSELDHPGDTAQAVPSRTLSDWLRHQDIVELARIARVARLVDGSFGRHLRDHGDVSVTRG